MQFETAFKLKRLVSIALACARVIAAVVAASLVIVAACPDEDVYSTHATFADAERDGAVAHGWMPGFIPSAATDITEAHNIDSNDQWIRFRAPPHALDAMVAKLEVADGSRLRPPRGHPPIRGAWPVLDAGTVPETLRSYRTPVEVGKSDIWCVAIDRGASIGYVWSCRPDGV